MAPPPLHGVRVVDFTTNLPGPYATWQLLRMGATVDKVEPPRGDPAKHSPALYARLNTGKQVRTVDLTTPEGVDEARALVAEAHVLVEGFRPGKLGKLGLSPEVCLGWNPRLIYCSISAYGQSGPLRDAPGHDLNAQALSGLLSLGGGDPHGLPVPVADLSAAMDAVARILAALRHAEATGEGAVIDVAMVDTVATWADVWGEGIRLDHMARDVLPKPATKALGGLLRRLRDERVHALPHYGCFRCRDGRWIALGIVDEGRFWRAACQVMGLRGIGRLPMGARAALGPTLRQVVALRLRTRSSGHWLKALGDAGVPVTPVHDLAGAKAEPQLARRPVGFPGAAG